MRIFCVTEYYLPGFKGGGPIRTLANMRALLGKDVQIAIFTRDRDLGSRSGYPGVPLNQWVDAENGPIYYSIPQNFGVRGVKDAVASKKFNILYLNSFFSYRASISLYLKFRRLKRDFTSILIAPRGEFSQGALSVKGWKKNLYLHVARALGLYDDVYWHASTPHEAQDILRQFPNAQPRIHLAADPVVVENDSYQPEHAAVKEVGKLNVAFISRISPMKNLDGLLEVLMNVKRNITLSVFGPIEDEIYWLKCQAKIKQLPPNIHVEYNGSLEPREVSQVFSKYDLFAFPTHGENFGHVIFEALRAGTPVLLSDKTPWQEDNSGAVSIAPLISYDIWRKKIEIAADITAEQQTEIRLATIEYAKNYIGSDKALQNNLKMFQAIAAGSRRKA